MAQWRDAMLAGGWTLIAGPSAGYTMKSGTQRGCSLTVYGREDAGSWKFDVRLNDRAMRTFTLGLIPRDEPVPPPPYSAPGDWYRIAVCPYQFALWLDGVADTDTSGTPGVAPRSFFCSMPWVPDGYDGHSSFVLGSFSTRPGFRSTLQWSAQTQFDSAPWSTRDIYRAVIPVMRTRLLTEDPIPADPLRNTQGAVVAGNAYVCSRKGDNIASSENRIAGKLWQCCVLQDNYPWSAVTAEMLGGTWVHLGSQYQRFFGAVDVWPQAASLWWKVE